MRKYVVSEGPGCFRIFSKHFFSQACETNVTTKGEVHAKLEYPCLATARDDLLLYFLLHSYGLRDGERILETSTTSAGPTCNSVKFAPS